MGTIALHEATAEAVNALNIAVGELAFALERDDPRRAALGQIQSGLDSLWRETSKIDRRRLDAAQGDAA